MEKPIGVEEIVSQLVQVRGREINLAQVLQRFNPDHIHWKEEEWGFETRPDLYKWLYTRGLPHFLRQKLTPNKDISLPEVSRRLYERYFGHHGIYGEIEVSGEGLLDYHTGVKIEPTPTSSLWPAQNVVKLFPEVDFRVQFDYPGADPKARELIQEEAFILLNTTKIGRERYKPHLLGYPLEGGRVVSLVHGRGYLNRLDLWLQNQGLTIGIQGLVATDHSRQLVEAFLEARLA